MFSLFLKGLREEKGLSQKALAQELGISQGTIGMLESGKREPSYRMFIAIANYFNVSLDYLAGRGKGGHR